MPDTSRPTSNFNADPKLLAAFSYVWILSVPIYFLKRSDPFVRFHSRQGLILFAASVVFSFIPILGWFLNIIVFLVVLVAFVRALSGEQWKIPYVSDLADRVKL